MAAVLSLCAGPALGATGEHLPLRAEAPATAVACRTPEMDAKVQALTAQVDALTAKIASIQLQIDLLQSQIEELDRHRNDTHREQNEIRAEMVTWATQRDAATADRAAASDELKALMALGPCR